MATETVNGTSSGYDQYSQPAELAASTPAANGASSTNNASSGQKPDPQEIGWYFVEQYYTTLSKTPDKIHLFYNKKSQLITGTEAEKVLPSVGSKAISEKIRSLEITDCKIRVLNVDCQASYDNIVVQVIGEMSNKNQPHHKFVQTFILATQPNGYFVLNDIFRYLSDSDDEIVEDEPAQQAAPEATPAPAETSAETETVEPEASREITEPTATPAAADEVVNTEAAAQQVDHELEDVKDGTSSTEEVNGDEPAEEEQISEPVEETKQETLAEPAAEEPKPVADSNSTSAPAPTSSAPPAKKTWASLVGTKSPAVPALPQASSSPSAATTVTPTQPKAQAPAQSQQNQTQTPRATSAAPTAKSTDSPAEPADAASAQGNGWQEAGKKPKQVAKANEGIVHAYIKNVNEKIDARVLREVLEKYGKLKYYDVSRPKQCAFVEFEDSSAYAAAVAENPHTVGSESINVEERRPRPGQGANYSGNFTRGAANASRGARGGAQQRAGSQSGNFNREAAGRGNFQGQRGNSKTSAATRGRGQAAA